MSRPAPSAFLRGAIALFGLTVVACPEARAQAPPGTIVRNVATVTWQSSGGTAESVTTNEVSFVVAPLRTRATLRLQRATLLPGTTPTLLAGTECARGGAFVPLSAPILLNGATADLSQPLPLGDLAVAHGGEALFLRITDPDQNLDAAVIDTIEVTVSAAGGDAERVRLRETAMDSGEFVGWLQTTVAPASAGDCVLQVTRDADLEARYVDPVDATDAASATALVDPFGRVFDSRTGAPVDGARVRIVSPSGSPVRVLGDDGVSAFPAEVLSGGTVTDAGGTVYAFAPGEFRFPLIEPGTYRFEIVPTAAYAFPSGVSEAALQALPGAPYRIVAGSFGGDFVLSGPVAVAIDVPLDPSDAGLVLSKTAATTIAAVGDFVQYALEVRNAGASGTAREVEVVDVLPAGVRYRPGSTRVDGAAASDPAVAPDGRTLTFRAGDLAPGAAARLRYVTEITVAARGPRLVNGAQARASGDLASNTAQAVVQLREELFRTKAIIAGRIVVGDCARDAAGLPGVPDVRVYLEDGRYVITDEEGKYHFDDVPPGAHVVQIDTITVPEALEPARCEDRVRHAGRSFSQFVDLRGGALWQADFVLAERPLPAGEVALTLRTVVSGDGPFADHVARIDVSTLPALDARLLVALPADLEYVAGSAGVPEAITEGVLTLRLGDLEPASQREVRWRTRTGPRAAGELPVRASLVFNTPADVGQRTAPVENRLRRGEPIIESAAYSFTPRFNVLDARVSEADRRVLDEIVAAWQGVRETRIVAVGHADATPVSARSRAIFPDNEALSRRRAEVVADYLAARLGVAAPHVSVEGRGSSEPVATGRDAESLARNRRVEIRVTGTRVRNPGTLAVLAGESSSPPVATRGRFGTSTRPAPAPTATAALAASGGREIQIERLEPGVGWLYPDDDFSPPIPSLKIAVRHAPSQTVELALDGTVVSTLNFDGVATNGVKTVAVSRWRGVDLRDGENALVATVRGEDGAVAATLTRTIHYAGGAVRAELVPGASTLVADGRTRPTVAVRLLDRQGKPARRGTIGAFRVDPPYRSWWEVESLRENQLVAVGNREPTWQVEEDGLARLVLEPTSQAGTATLRVRLNERQTQELRVWLTPSARDWVLVAIAEGSAAYRTISANAEPLAVPEEGYADEGRVAFFAKGRIRGDFLLTVAYDSARDGEEARQRLLGVVEPDRFYTLYGDGSDPREEAASARKLFLRLERRQFVALFGDYETGLTVTELTRYSRTLNGLRTDWAGERFGLSAFAAETDLGFVKDELRGDGTSGLYRLSRRELVGGSDKVRIEVRDRFRSEIVIETRPLQRFLDYAVDYLDGTLFFRQPVPSRDPDLNPVYIIAEYEVRSGGEYLLTAGARGTMRFAADRGEAGATFIEEGGVDGDSRIAGLDARLVLGLATELRAEVARSESDDPAREADAHAWLAEVHRVTERVDTRAYVREQEAGFGTGQQLSTELGTRRAGVDARVKVGESWHGVLEVFGEDVLDSDAERRHASVEVRREVESSLLGLGLRSVEDEGGGERRRSEQAIATARYDLPDGRTSLRGSAEVGVSGRGASADYPDRYILGADYAIMPEATLFAEYEHAEGTDLETDMTRIGVRATPWNRTRIDSSVSQATGEFGPRTFANVGLTQGWQATERLALDLGFDQSRTLTGPGLAPVVPERPLASGSLTEDFFAAFAGALYRSATWTATSRLEHRDGDAEDRWLVSAGLYREPLRGRAFSAALRWRSSDFSSGEDDEAAEVQLSWAWRPAESSWIVLDRLDLRHERRVDGVSVAESSRLVNNANVNWQFGPHLQLGLQWGVRWVRSTFDGERYDGLSDLWGIDLRRDLTPRFDVGLHGTALNSWESSVRDFAVGFDVGVTVARNVWVSIGYNVVGFDDDDFRETRWTSSGPYVKLRIKADQDTFKDLVLDRLKPPVP